MLRASLLGILLALFPYPSSAQMNGAPKANQFAGLSSAGDVNLSVGAATTSVAIEVPPGRNGMAPKLQLVYTSGGGPSPFGVGWDLPIGKVQRSGKHGVLSCHSDLGRNAFVVMLPSATVECTLAPESERTPGGRLPCRARIEENFLKIFHVAQGGANHWEVWDKRGDHYVFGTDPAAREGVTTSALWAAGDDCRYTWSWGLELVEDRNGNTIDYAYAQVDGSAYVQSIGYGVNRHVAGGMGQPFEVTFHWRGASGTPPVSATKGYYAEATQLLDRIEVHNRFVGKTVRTYDLIYEFEEPANEFPEPLGRQSFLVAVRMAGRDGTLLARADGAAAASTYVYRELEESDFHFDLTDTWFPSHISRIPLTVSNGEKTVADIRDIDGDSFPDLIDATACHPQNLYWRVHRGTRSGFNPVAMHWVVQRCAIVEGNVLEVEAVEADTFDLTGDGVADQVAREHDGAIVVFAGLLPVAESLPRFDSVPIDLNVSGYIRMRVPTDYGMQVELNSFKDTNGDALPDLLIQGSARLNLGPSISYSFDNFGVQRREVDILGGDKGDVERDAIDLTGDGLLENVSEHPSGWNVCYSSGRNPSGQCQVWQFPSDCGHHLRADGQRELADMNADGLLDLVDNCGWEETGTWSVYFNTGRSLSSPVSWMSPRAELGIVADFDADGFADAGMVDDGTFKILRNGAGAWLADAGEVLRYQSSSAPRGFLLAFENGVGGSTHFQYRPSSFEPTPSDLEGSSEATTRIPFPHWNVAKITQDSGIQFTETGSSTIEKFYWYARGRYDPTERIFLGFGGVTISDASGTLMATEFGETASLSGRPLRSATFPPGADVVSADPLDSVDFAWECLDLDSLNPNIPELIDCNADVARKWVRLRSKTQRQFGPNNASTTKVDETTLWDRYGNPMDTRSRGVDASGIESATVRTRTWFRTLDDLSMDGSDYIVDRPRTVEVLDGNEAIERRSYVYDFEISSLGVRRGNVVQSGIWLDQSTVAVPDSCDFNGTLRPCIASRYEYDTLGNVMLSTDARGGTTRTTYDALGIYPSTVTNAMEHVVSYEYDSSCGELIAHSLPNSDLEYRYYFDDFCRLIGETAPGDGFVATVRQYDYYVGSPGVASDLYVRETQPYSPTGYVERDELFDGLGRRLQVQQATVVDGVRKFLAVDSVEFDACGNVKQRYEPIEFNDQTLGPGLNVEYVTPSGPRTTYWYDDLNRTVAIQRPNGGVEKIDFTTPGERVTTDACYNSQACIGSRTVERFDAFGNVVERMTYAGNVPAPGELKAHARYKFNGEGRMVFSEDKGSSGWDVRTRTTVTYDSAGRKVGLDDPDSGIWTFGYDLAGNLIFENDPKVIQHKEVCYDALGRIVAEFYDSSSESWEEHCTNPENGDVVYSYDDESVPFGTGQLTSVTDSSGTTFFHQYDPQGRVLRKEKQLRVGNVVEPAHFVYQYDWVGNLYRIEYPDGEIVQYGYDEVGRVRSLQSISENESFLTDLTYDRYGRERQLTHGNGPNGIGVIESREYYASGAGARFPHLQRLAVIPAAGALGTPGCGSGAALFNVEYAAYSLTGKVERINDFLAPAGGGVSLCTPLDTSATVTYDGVGRVYEVAGNARLNGRYRYDLLGNMAEMRNVSLQYTDSQRPHAPVIYGSGPVPMEHDANGNRVQKGTSTYDFDVKNRLVGVGENLEIVYDYADRMVMKRSGTSRRRYFDALAEYHLSGANHVLTKYYFAGERRIASRQVFWHPETGSPYAASDAEEDWLYSVYGLGGWLGAAIVVVALGLVVAPGNRSGRRPTRQNGKSVSSTGAVGLVAVLLIVQIVPSGWTEMPRRAHANGGGGGTSPPFSLRQLHYHTDHLGSTVTITNDDGHVVSHVRYDLHGRATARLSASLTTTSAADRYEFTGYETDGSTSLQYAGARWYDSQVGLFLTHDPKGVFPSPYTYLGGDPLNQRDVNGEQPADYLRGGIPPRMILGSNSWNGMGSRSLFQPQHVFIQPVFVFIGFEPGPADTSDVGARSGPTGLAQASSRAESRAGLLIAVRMQPSPFASGTEHASVAHSQVLTSTLSSFGLSAGDVMFRTLVFDYREPAFGSYPVELILALPVGKPVKAIGWAVDWLRAAERRLVNLASPQRTTHILAGDATGGGHLFPGAAGKSPFPESWSGDRVMHEISDVATDPGSVFSPGRGGRTVVTGTRDGVDITVILESPSRGGGIVTGFPTNVSRNP